MAQIGSEEDKAECRAEGPERPSRGPLQDRLEKCRGRPLRYKTVKDRRPELPSERCLTAPDAAIKQDISAALPPLDELRENSDGFILAKEKTNSRPGNAPCREPKPHPSDSAPPG